MEGLFTLDSLITLLMLIFLQIVLGFDNLLYISIESKRVEAGSQSMVRKTGLGLAIIFRLVLLYAILKAVDSFQAKMFGVDLGDLAHGSFNLHSLIVLFGGIFITYTAVREIHHMLSVENIEHVNGGKTRSVAMAITMIVVMNLIFSFDSILSAMALTRIFVIMATAIIISGVMMILLADTVAEFLKKNRMYEVLGLFILLIVGVMLLSEGGHLAHLHLFGQPVEPMAKTTFYFVIITLVIVDVIQTRYQKKLARLNAKERGAA
jgi:predicted tellurium resistance membrane protein TerC